MVALLQGSPPAWQFAGRKTRAYRQLGNAFRPPVAAAIARKIKHALLRQEHPRFSFEDVA